MSFLIVGTTKIKYLGKTKRSADPEPHGYYGYGHYPYYHLHGYKPASIANIDYGKTGIKYLTKRSADPAIRREAESEAGPMAGPMDMEAGPKAGPTSEADPSPYYGYYGGYHGYYPYNYRYGYHNGYLNLYG